MNSWNQNEETVKKSQSPNSIYFYLKRYDGDEERAKSALDEYRSRMKGKIKGPHQVSYWVEKGYSEPDARLKVSESQSKRTKGKRFTNNPFDGEVRNHMEKLNICYEEAFEIACQRRRKCSPRRIEYWADRGYSESEAKSKVSELQRSFSKRCIEYWIGVGHSEEEAARLLSESQDKTSLKRLMEKLDCSLEEALAISNDKNGEADEVFVMMLLYFTYRVRQSSEKVYKTCKSEIDPNGLRGKDYHLDHIKPIRRCFIEGMSIEEASSPSNLRIITSVENLKKRDVYENQD